MAASSDKIRVLVVDDSFVCRAALTRILESDPSVEVVGEAEDGVQALEKIQALSPSLVTLDLQMPRMGGLETIERVMSAKPTPILVITELPTADGLDATFASLSRGALDLMLKPTAWPGEGESGNDLLERVRRLSKVRVTSRGAPQQPALWTSARLRSPLQVVGIGASTGGPGALAKVLEELPEALTAPVLVVQHIDAAFNEFFAKWLAGRANRPVKVAAHGEAVQPSTIYVAPPGRDMTFDAKGKLALVPPPKRALHVPSVDSLFHSLAPLGERALGILLTGMGQDGALGLQAMHKAGALTIAQDEATSVVWGMPRAAVDLGAVDHVLGVSHIGPFLGELLSRKPGRSSAPAMTPAPTATVPERQRKKVLILDDSEIILAAARAALEEAGFKAVTLSNPLALPRTVRLEAPDLVLLDINMPAISGDAAMKIVREHGVSSIPVLLFSELPGPELERRAKICGAAGWLSKSADAFTLVRRIRELIEKR